MGSVPLPQADTIDEVEQSNIFVTDANDGSAKQPKIDGDALLVALSQGTVTVTRGPVKTDSGTGANLSGGVQLDLENTYSEFDLHWDVSIDGNIIVEVSPDNSAWRPLKTIDTTGQNVTTQSNIVTNYQYVRAYADGGTFADSDVNLIEISAKE